MPRRTPSLLWRILLRQLPLLALLFVGVLFWLSSYLEGILYSAHLEQTRRASQHAAVAVEATMHEEGAHPDWDRVLKRVGADSRLQIEILNNRGKVLVSHDPARRGKKHALSEPVCTSCHVGGALKATRKTAFWESPGGKRFQVLALPLLNRQTCQHCHAKDGPKLGLVLVRGSLEPIHEQIRRVYVYLAIAGLVALVLAIGTTRLLLGRYLGRPLRRLVKGAEAIGAGDLQQSIELPEPSELSVLADTLNKSAARLDETVRHVARQRDDFQKLYELASHLSRGVVPEERRRRAVRLANELLRLDLLLLARWDGPEGEPGRGTITYRDEAGEIVDREVAFDELDPGLSPLCSPTLIERWAAGELDRRVVAVEGRTVAFPLQRHGRRLGLLLVADTTSGGDGDTLRALEPDTIPALCEYFAIMLEISGLQRELVEQERLAAIGETVAGMAHFMKNILNGLRAGQYVIDSARKRGDDEKLGVGLQVLGNTVLNIERFTMDMLYYVKEREPLREPVDLNAVLTSVADLLREMARGLDVELTTELEVALGEQRLDRTAIYRAILNLATNAVDACAESEAGHRVVLRSRLSDDEVLLEVEDDGVGMAPEHRERIFERFFSTKASKGTGLGLAVVDKIVSEHGGRIEVDSTPGEGTTFRIHLPMDSSDSSAEALQAPG